MEHTKDEWEIQEHQGLFEIGTHNEPICKLWTLEEETHDKLEFENAEANAKLIAEAPIRHQQMLALTIYGWEVEKVSLYDEEGIEGWRWTEPNGTEHTETGDWSDLPPWPDSARKAIAKAKT